MRNDTMFEIATRAKLRFPFKGLVSVEDLWDLNVESLDSIFKQLNAQVKRAGEESLLHKKSTEDEALEVQVELIKYIVSVKLDEENQRLLAKSKKEQRQRLLALRAEKQDADLRGKSIEEIDAMLAELEV